MLFLILSLLFLAVISSEAPQEPPNREYDPIRFQGDITLPHNLFLRARRGAPDTSNPNLKWPTDQPISFTLDETFEANYTRLLKDAFKFWSDNTCLTFEEFGTTKPLIQVLNTNDCTSLVGRQWKKDLQVISLGNDCNTIGTIQHEIAHVLGLGHSQMRHDRDEYITIDFENLKQGADINFKMMSEEKNDNFGIEYDYGSVMHYDGLAFAKDDSRPSIIAKDPDAQSTMGQRDRAAFSDIRMLNALYDCQSKCAETLVECKNGGIVNSKTCNTCICPYMFTGADCSERHPGRGFNASTPSCGMTIEAEDDWRYIRGSVGVLDNVQYKNNLSECFWNIVAPPNRQIELRLHETANLQCHARCVFSGLEIYMKGQTQSGYRLCCPAHFKGRVIRSTTNQVTIRAYTQYNLAAVDVDVRYV